MLALACAACPAPAPLTVVRLTAPSDADARIDLRTRRDLLPQVRRDTALRITVDLVEQPDLAALARALPEGLTRRRRGARVAAALRQGTGAARAFAAEMEERAGISRVKRAHCMARVSFTGPASLVREMAQRDDVLAVWARLPEDAAFGPVGPRAPESAAGEAPPWAPVALNAPQAWEAGARGRGALACIMESLPPEEPRALRGRRAALTHAPGSELPDEGRGHGLAVLGAAVGADGFGVAPDAQWCAVNPLAHGELEPEGFAASVDWLLDMAHPDVVMAPWDVPEDVPPHALAWPFGALRAAGIAVVFPAGNGGPSAGDNRPPANLVGLAPDGASAFSVGGLSRAMQAYDVSNRGPNARDGSLFPIVAAPAVDVLVVEVGGSGRLANGTSYAAGFVGGALALVLAEHPEMTGPEAEALLGATARDLGAPGDDMTFGHGMIDVAAALAAAKRR